MTPLMALGMSILISLVLSTLLVRVLSRPLQAVLREICPSSDASRFWVAFTSVMLYVAPLLITVWFQRFDYGVDFARTIRATLATTLFGSSAALLVVGWQIAKVRPAALKSNAP